MGFSTLVSISVIAIVLKKIVYTIKNEKKIDQRLRARRARIAQVITDLEENKDLGSEASTEFVVDNLTSQPKIEKKTRAMSMEERWAEFDKKRAIRSTA